MMFNSTPSYILVFTIFITTAGTIDTTTTTTTNTVPNYRQILTILFSISNSPKNEQFLPLNSPNFSV